MDLLFGLPCSLESPLCYSRSARAVSALESLQSAEIREGGKERKGTQQQGGRDGLQRAREGPGQGLHVLSYGAGKSWPLSKRGPAWLCRRWREGEAALLKSHLSEVEAWSNGKHPSGYLTATLQAAELSWNKRRLRLHIFCKFHFSYHVCCLLITYSLLKIEAFKKLLPS